MAEIPIPRPADEDTPQGLAYAVGAYVFWGFLPLFMKLVSHIPVPEVIAHRILWSLPIAGLVVVLSGRTAALRAALRTPRMLLMAGVAAFFLSINWGLYVLAIVTDRALDASLGYYINPLFSVFLGAVLLGERLTRSQLAAVALAGLAVAILFIEAARPPWIPLGLTLTWGIYAFLKKSLPVGPNQGFTLEVLLLTPPALLYILWLAGTGEGLFAQTGWDTLLLLGCGVVTAVPLLIYANGAKLLRLSSIAILQYIAPTLIFLVAVFVFDEELDRARMIAFPMIWAALIIYTAPMVRRMRRRAR